MSLLRLAIQKSGRLTDSSRALISECGIELEQAGAKLRAQAFFPWRCQGGVLFTWWLERRDFWGYIERLRAAGAEGILVLPVEKVI